MLVESRPNFLRRTCLKRKHRIKAENSRDMTESNFMSQIFLAKLVYFQNLREIVRRAAGKDPFLKIHLQTGVELLSVKNPT